MGSGALFKLRARPPSPPLAGAVLGVSLCCCRLSWLLCSCSWVDLGPVLQVAPLLVLGLYPLRAPRDLAHCWGWALAPLGEGWVLWGPSAAPPPPALCICCVFANSTFLGGATFPGGLGVPCLHLRLNVSHMSPWCELAGRKNDPQTC